MSAKRLHLIMLILVIGCQQAGISANNPVGPADEKVAETELSRQLGINREALLQGPNEQIRIDAATVMLFSEEPLARRVLLETLRQSENTAAQAAVCKALGRARAGRKIVENKQDFIQPLLGVLTTKTSPAAKLAAEATLIFEYEQISEPLEKIITDASLPANARLNAIHALKLQPDMRAIFKLIDLLDDADKEVAAASEQALHSLGIPIGKDAETRKQIVNELKRKGKNEFLRDWLIRQEVQMRNLEAELNLWRGLYLFALGRIYDGISDDATKGKFLAEHLRSSEAIVRLWALEKVAQWRVGTKSKLPAELGPILVNLVSDQDRNVRLKTAKLLSLMGQLNSAGKLLEQHEAEQDDEVRTELFVALGWACYYASLPDSKFKISPETRKHTLELASEYLSEQEAKKAQKGAEVVKKLLEQDGLTSADVGKYLGWLVGRYNQEKNKTDGSLRGEFLSAMAELCAQSVYKADARKLFKSLFEQGLSDEADLVRQAAVDGLIHIDRTRALKTFRKALINDNSIKVREKIINLAGEVGGGEDLVWLAEKIGSTTAGEPAWQAMLKIFKHSDAAILAEWLQNFTSQSSETGLSDEQMISFLKIAEQKAAGENKAEVLKSAREKLAQLYTKIGDFEQAAKYFGLLHETAQTVEEKEAILPNLLYAYLRWPNVQAVTQLVGNCLLQNDLDANNVIVLSIDSYLEAPPAGGDPNVILEALAAVELAGPRPEWHQQMKRWTDRFAHPTGTEEPK